MTRAEYSLSGYLNLRDNVWCNHLCPSICYHSYLNTSGGHCLGLSVLHVLHISVEYRWSEFITKWFLFADWPHVWLLGLRSTSQIHFEFRRYELTTHAISDLCIIVEINVLHNFYIPLEQCLGWRHHPLEKWSGWYTSLVWSRLRMKFVYPLMRDKECTSHGILKKHHSIFAEQLLWDNGSYTPNWDPLQHP